MKALGSEIKKFYNEGWPTGYYHETDLELDVEIDELEDNLPYELARLGLICPESDSGECYSFQEGFKKWKKAQTTALIVIEVPKDEEKLHRDTFKSMGYKVRK